MKSSREDKVKRIYKNSQYNYKYLALTPKLKALCQYILVGGGIPAYDNYVLSLPV